MVIDAIAGSVHRRERPVGAGRQAALLPSAHAALSDPACGEADRPRPVKRPRPDRILVVPTRTGAGGMKVGVPTEIKTDEYRVALTPAGVRELVDAGHEVVVQRGAGLGSSIADDA